MVTDVVYFSLFYSFGTVGNIKIHYFITERVFRIQSICPVSATVNLEYMSCRWATIRKAKEARRSQNCLQFIDEVANIKRYWSSSILTPWMHITHYSPHILENTLSP